MGFKKGHVASNEEKLKIKEGLIRSWKTRDGYHGMYNTKFYNSWRSMTTRCRGTCGEDSKKKYRDKGITVCERWQKFSGFYEDMFPSYIEGLTIDRVDNAKGYYKENCRWATISQQAYNKSKTVILNFNGQSFTMDKAAEFIGIPKTRLRDHYYKKFKTGLINESDLFDRKRYRD